MTGAEVNEKLTMKVEKALPSTKEAQAAKFTEEVKPIIEGVEGVTVSVKAQLGAGDMYKVINNVTTLDDEAPVSIEHKQGEVLMIDFWATWCPPCQKPMQHNEDMLTANAEKWGDKVKIIGLSIDKDAATVKSHVTAKGWLKPIHYWRSKSDCSDVYSVRGVPHVMLIDTNGKIAFKGHPANRPDLVADFDALLAGKTLEGEGCGPAAAAAEGDAPEGFKASTDAELAEIQAHMTRFKETGKDMQTALKESAKGMQRDFCVLTLEANMSPSTMTW